jgi:hypothetical protein
MRLAFALFLLCGAFASAQSGACLDVADESHHQLVFQNESVRVFILDLPRLAATESHCHSHPFLDVVVSEGRSSNTLQGRSGISHDWVGPEARFFYPPMQHVVRNESNSVYRELIVETLRQANYESQGGNYDVDLFPSDLGSTKATWTVSFSRGALTASKSQLAPGAEIAISGAGHVLLALTDLDLRTQVPGKPAEELHLSTQEVRILPAGSSLTLANAAKDAAKFVLVEF